jgi:hypothetical protein
MEEGEVEGSMVTGRFSSDEADESEWSGNESASVIAERIRQQRRDSRIPRMNSNRNQGQQLFINWGSKTRYCGSGAKSRIQDPKRRKDSIWNLVARD